LSYLNYQPREKIKTDLIKVKRQITTTTERQAIKKPATLTENPQTAELQE